MQRPRTSQLTVVSVLLASASMACTAASPDVPSGSDASAGAGTGGSPSTGGAGGSAPSGATAGGPVAGAAGSTAGGSTAGGSGGSTSAGGAAGGSPGGTGGSQAGGASGSAGSQAGGAGGSAGSQAGGAGGSTATGCNWVHDPTNDTWSFNPASADKIVLFDGTTLKGWHPLNMPGVPIIWKLVSGGAMQVVTPSGATQATEVQTDMKFDNVCVHVEYMTPRWTASNPPDVQKQGNSGVYLKSAYEMQILDTSMLSPLIDGCGAVYKVSPPAVVACNPYPDWNTYEIEFQSSVWTTAGKKSKDAVFVRVALNGKLVQLNVQTPAAGMTQGASAPDAPGPQPLGLQDHLQPVQFRNIWATIPSYQ